MPSAFTHALVGAAAAQFLPADCPRWRAAAVFALAATLPDLDVVAFTLGIPYEHPFGHRGFAHSLLFALLLGTAAALLVFASVDSDDPRRAKIRWRPLLLVGCLAVASHGLLDYGQYWLEPWPLYDSTIHATLGSYFESCGAKWKCDQDKQWMRFLPSPLEAHFTVETPTRFEEYLSESDWVRIDQLARDVAEPSQAAIAVTHANELIGENRHRHALIECVTAFELAFAERVRQQLGSGTPVGKDLAKQQSAMNNKQRMMCIAAFVDSISKDQIKLALEAIDERHRVVHEGWSPKHQRRTTRRVKAMLHVCRALIAHHNVKLPRLTTGNVLKAPEAWEAGPSMGS